MSFYHERGVIPREKCIAITVMNLLYCMKDQVLDFSEVRNITNSITRVGQSYSV